MSKYGLTAGQQCYKFSLLTLISNPVTSQNDVWLAEDMATKTQVALKIISGAPVDVPNRLYEAQVGAKLKHTNLCEVIGADLVDIPSATVDGGIPTGPFVLIGFRYQPQGACTRLLEGPGVMRVDRVHRLLLDVLAGLEYLHEQGLHHNDIKPANILLSLEGNYLLTDYGITWSEGTSNTAQAYLPHIAPESLETNSSGYTNIHHPCASTDIFQLGLSAYRLLNGAQHIRGEFDKHLASGTIQKFFDGVRNGTIPDRQAYGQGIPQRLRMVVNRAIEVDPAKRYASALEMRRDVEKLYYPYVWQYDTSNELVLNRGKVQYSIELLQKGSKYDIAAIATYTSGKVVRPSEFKATGLSKAKATSHVRSIRQALMKP